ncbi:MAG: TRAP transporter substrate-binding protein, partial [Chloroflexi bacterium]|nr:TRAP transporter substrate-binding protein [Chloroflexota bacterium]
GRVKLEVFPGAQLGSNIDNIDQVSKGTLQMTMQNPVITSQLSPQIGVFAAPFLFPDLQSVYKAAASPVGQRIVEDLRTRRNIRALDPWYLGGWNLLTNKKPAHRCEDLAGMKMRVPPGPVLKDFLEQCGAGVVAMDFSEVYLALKTGVIDGIPMPLAIIESGKLHEVTKYVTLHTFLYDLFHPLIHEGTWTGLSPEDQKLIAETFAVGRDINEKLAAEQESGAVKLFETHKLQVDKSPDVPSFVRAAEKTWAKFESQWGGKEVIQQLREAAK